MPQAYTRFERARIIGARALQISMGAPSLLEFASSPEPLSIASSEFTAGIAPLNVTRVPHALG
jgi:DNA-directed RNA polymerase subunit K